jgi:NDP-sugar pyrophosphorylase family protein
MKVVMPMAGRGSRFQEEGIDLPKPLVPVAGLPMFVRALASLGEDCESEVIFIALREHEEKYGLRELITSYVQNPFQLVLIDDITKGQLCTVLCARHYLPNEEDLLVMSSDTAVVSNIIRDIKNQDTECEGIISTCELDGEQWSFAETDSNGYVISVAEKIRISPNASTGLYYFNKSGKFLRFADHLIANQMRTGGEYYVIPVYQEYIRLGSRITLSHASELWDMGTIEAKRRYENYLKEGHGHRSGF